MGCELSSYPPEPAAVEIGYGNGGLVAGIAWLPGNDAILFIHGGSPDASSDDWRDLPERFAVLGYGALAVDLPGFGGSPGSRNVSGSAAVAAAVDFLRESGAARIFALIAGESLEQIQGQTLDALVLMAPKGPGGPSLAGTIPKLILAGSAAQDQLAAIKEFAQACRGWTLLSTFACENTLDALLNSRHANQILVQAASFLHDYWSTVTPAASKTEKRISL